MTARNWAKYGDTLYCKTHYKEVFQASGGKYAGTDELRQRHLLKKGIVSDMYDLNVVQASQAESYCVRACAKLLRSRKGNTCVKDRKGQATVLERASLDMVR